MWPYQQQTRVGTTAEESGIQIFRDVYPVHNGMHTAKEGEGEAATFNGEWAKIKGKYMNAEQEVQDEKKRRKHTKEGLIYPMYSEQ